MEVWEQCLVDFQIGQYKDQVWCDIMDMNSCHMLLGRLGSMIVELCMIMSRM